MKKLTFKMGLAMLVCCQLFFVSCNEEGSLGDNLLPGDKPGLSKTDTFSVYASTVEEDSLQAGYNSLFLSYPSSFQLGKLVSSKFGETNAGFTCQARLPKDDVNFGTNVRLDSLVLTLSYLNYYGDTTSSLEVEVLELDQEINIDSAYYSSSVYATKPNLLASLTVNPKPQTLVRYYEPGVDDTTFVDSIDGRKSQLRIRLSSAFAMDLFSKSGMTELSSSTEFLSYFKGFLLRTTATNGNGCVVSFNLTSAFTNLSLFYTDLDGDMEAKKFDFPVNFNSVKTNFYDHDYMGSEAGAFLNTVNPSNEKVYVQGLGGLKTKLEFPFLSKLNEQRIVVNKAVIEINTDNFDDDFYPPDELVVLAVGEDGQNLVLPFQAEQQGFFSDTENKYTVNISSPIQALLSEEIQYGYYLVPINSSIWPHQVEIFAPNSSMNGMKLVMTITELP